jgi:hypothetical protein
MVHSPNLKKGTAKIDYYSFYPHAVEKLNEVPFTPNLIKIQRKVYEMKE